MVNLFRTRQISRALGVLLNYLLIMSYIKTWCFTSRFKVGQSTFGFYKLLLINCLSDAKVLGEFVFRKYGELIDTGKAP